MRATQDFAKADAPVVLSQLVLASVVGLILVPSLLVASARAAPPGIQNVPAVGWLGVGLLLTAWLIALASSLVRLVEGGATAFRRQILSEGPSNSREAHNLARWLVAFAEILLVQAILRPPLVVLLGGAFSPANAEALVAAITLAALLLVLIWVHRTARPLVETAARSTLDVFLASGAPDATIHAVAPPGATTIRPVRRATESATQLATRSGEATVAAEPVAPTLPEAGKETLLAPADTTVPDASATRRGGTKTLGGSR